MGQIIIPIRPGSLVDAVLGTTGHPGIWAEINHNEDSGPLGQRRRVTSVTISDVPTYPLWIRVEIERTIDQSFPVSNVATGNNSKQKDLVWEGTVPADQGPQTFGTNQFQIYAHYGTAEELFGFDPEPGDTPFWHVFGKMERHWQIPPELYPQNNGGG